MRLSARAQNADQNNEYDTVLPSAKRPEDVLDETALDLAVEEAIAEHGGDAREAIRALLIFSNDSGGGA
jgi:hypothetical protein